MYIHIHTHTRLYHTHNFIIVIGSHYIEAEKFQDLPSSWRTRKADGVVQSEFKGLRTGAGEGGMV